MNLEAWVLENETTIRMSCFFGVFAIMALWEMLNPCRELTVSKPIRWLSNLGLVFLNSFIVRLLFPMAAVGVAAFAQQAGWGIFNYYPIPTFFAVLATIVLMDFAIYIQHVMFHAVPMLWRLHQVHHADLDYDVTTGARFHTIEIVLSMLIKFAVIIVLGAPVVAVVLFEVILNATAMFNHSNISLPAKLDKSLRYLLVTPDMHRVHHSVHANEANSNFGFSLTWWDRLMGTYCENPKDGQQGMQIGIHTHRDPKKVSHLLGMLRLPFVKKREQYSINQRW